VGVVDGNSVGVSVGGVVGASVGEVGTKVGTAVGTIVGSRVGAKEGARVGTGVASEGAGVAYDGQAVGAVGARVGEAVGGSVQSHSSGLSKLLSSERTTLVELTLAIVPEQSAGHSLSTQITLRPIPLSLTWPEATLTQESTSDSLKAGPSVAYVDGYVDGEAVGAADISWKRFHLLLVLVFGSSQVEEQKQ